MLKFPLLASQALSVAQLVRILFTGKKLPNETLMLCLFIHRPPVAAVLSVMCIGRFISNKCDYVDPLTYINGMLYITIVWHRRRLYQEYVDPFC